MLKHIELYIKRFVIGIRQFDPKIHFENTYDYVFIREKRFYFTSRSTTYCKFCVLLRERKMIKFIQDRVVIYVEILSMAVVKINLHTTKGDNKTIQT